MATRNTVWRWNDMRNQRKNRKAPLEQLMEGWLLWGNFSPRTRQGYAEIFTGFLAWMQDQGREGVLGELDPLLARKWQQWLEAKGCSGNTVRGFLTTLKSFSGYLIEERIVLGKGEQPLNLLADVKVPKLPRSRPQVYSDADIEKVLESINRDRQYSARNLALIRLMLDGGQRLSQACSVLTTKLASRPDESWSAGRSPSARKSARPGSAGRLCPSCIATRSSPDPMAPASPSCA